MNQANRSGLKQSSAGRWFWRGAILAVIALSFFFRLRALTLFQFHIDEFFTLAAADFISQSGLPRYPTGLFYDPGLPYSYLSGALFWLLGFSEALGRWPAVIFGVLAVATTYWLGLRLLRAPAVGLLAALWLALSLESVEWGGRARMITLAQWLVLFSAGLLYLGLTRESTKYRLTFALSYGLALLSHFAVVVLMPAWFVAAAALWLIKAIRFQMVLIRDSLFLGLIFALAISSGVIFQPPPSVEFQQSNSGLETKVGALGDKFLQFPSDIGHAWEAYYPYFATLPHGPLLILAVVGLAASLLRLARPGRGQPRDPGALFLGLLFLTVMAVLAFLIDPHWQRARYLLMQVQGFFLLLAGHGVREVILWLPHLNRLTSRPNTVARQGAVDPGPGRGSTAPLRARKLEWIYAVGGLILSLALTTLFLPPLDNIIEGGQTGWNRYDQAFGYVREHMAAGDKVMTMHPPAGLLYLDQSDYYLVQSSPKLIVRPDGELGDRYSGALWLDTTAEFNRLLAGPDRIWLVTQEFWLFNSYGGYLQQQILWQMDKLWGEGGVWALAGRPGAWPLAAEPEVLLNAEFDGGAKLLGFAADPNELVPGSAVHFTLFWQGNIPYGAKILVHLRDAGNNTVAQADHFIYDGKVPSSRWPSLIKNDAAIRDGATLALPPDLAPGVYRILVGFYHPQTFERLGVIDDQSGESAVILGEWIVE